MIEVLIAVVVLGFGLMALAALQASIIRSSAETKAQTVALQLAKDKVEDLRSFQTLAGYQALTSGSDTPPDSAVTYARTWTVTRFGYQPSVGVFAAIANLTGATPAAAPPVAAELASFLSSFLSWFFWSFLSSFFSSFLSLSFFAFILALAFFSFSFAFSFLALAFFLAFSFFSFSFSFFFERRKFYLWRHSFSKVPLQCRVLLRAH